MLLRLLYVFITCVTVALSPALFCPAFADEDGFDVVDEESYDDLGDTENSAFMYSESAGDNDSDLSETTDIVLNDSASSIDVSNFDIAGIMLGMSFEDVYNLYHDQGNLYSPRKRNSLVYTIPQDWKYNLDYECRQSGVVQPSKLEKCIRGLARSRGLLYVAEIHLERAKTGETIDVYLTSNATDNVVYRIVYNNDADDKEGENEKFGDQREKKLLVFWKNVIKKYGSPNSGQDTWATSTNSYDPKMIAYYGALELIDENRHAMDEALAAQQSRENFRAKPYAF